MDFLSFAIDRYSVRRFLPEHLPLPIVASILATGMVAPTACNYQAYRVLVLNTDESIEKLKSCTKCHFNAPTAMLVCSHSGECWKRPYDGASSGPIDASIVATHMMLQAHAKGVGCCWVMHFDPQAMRETYHIPDELEPIALLVMGYPAEDAVPLPLHIQYRPLTKLTIDESF